jgi:acyl carrier protein
MSTAASTSTEHTLIELASARFGVDVSSLTPSDDFFEKLGIDSIQALDLLTDVEDRFDVEIPDYELQGVVTFAALAACIEKRR